ncbi:MAG: 5-(carboxyamino)imidazole ribonucleotide mutase [Muribaculaceae bacterium]
MTPLVSIIMGSTSDLPILRKAADFLEQMQIPFEMNALSAHRTPAQVEQFARGARDRGIKVIIAAAGMAAALPGVIAAMTPLPVVGVPINSSLDGTDALLSIVQMPPGIPVATMGINGAMNAAILAVKIVALTDPEVAARLDSYRERLVDKIVKANEELAKIDTYKYKV